MLLTATVILMAIFGVESANILGIFPTPASSHFILGFRIMKELVDRGHQVTVVSPFPQEIKIENYTDVSIENTKHVLNDFQNDFYSREDMSLISSTTFLHEMAHKLTEALLSDDNFQDLLKSQQKFDLIVMEYFMNEATLGVGNIFQAPIVLLSTLPSSALNNHLFANPAPSAYIPNILTQYTGVMNFWQRANNLAYNAFNNFYKQFFMLPIHDNLLKKYINKHLSLEDATMSVSLILLNSHPSVTEPVPHTPNMIEIGGFHVGKPKKLPTELEEFMDSATEGIILFSMGSNLKSSDMSQRNLDAILAAFSKLKQKVLWKFENSNLPGLPENVKIVNWLPQQDVLAHPNTKTFISHGGLLSTIEAVYFGIPFIGIPIYGDQKHNIAESVKNGFAISIPLREISEEKLDWAIKEILNNPRYTSSAKIRSNMMNDQIIKPIDSAMFWIEYVLRHNGANHLQSPGVLLPWYKRHNTDIILILIIIDVVLFLIFYYILKHIIHHVVVNCRNNKHKKYASIEKNLK